MTEPLPEKIVTPENAASDTRSRDGVGETLNGSGQTPSNHGSSPATPMPEVFGRYRILRRLGQGAMGTVYLALDSQLDRQVALKVPQFGPQKNSEGLERFFREARVMASLRHPNLCPVYDAGEIAGTYYLTMAFIDGKPLSELFRPLWPQREVAVLFQKLARALHEAHKAGIIHRDLKPANIMIEHGEPIIMDFGLARRDMVEDLTLTKTGMIVGTPAYMSPEQVAGEKNVGAATDIYSLGVILYQMLAGELPFQGSLVTVLGKIVMSAPAPLKELRTDVDEMLESICLKALSKQPEDRFSNGTQMSAAFAAYLGGDSDPQLLVTDNYIAFKPPSTQSTKALPTLPTAEQPAAKAPAAAVNVTEMQRRWSRSPVTIAAVGVAAVLLVVAGAWGVWTKTRQNPDGKSSVAINDPSTSSENSANTSPGTTTNGADAASTTANESKPPVEPTPPPPELTPREKVLAALRDGEFATALEMLDELTQQPDATDDDFANRARALLGLAESSDDPAAYFRRAAEDFGRAKKFADQALALHAAASNLSKRAAALAKEPATNDKQLAALDQEAIAEYYAAIEIAEQHELPAGAEWQAELATFERSPRFAQRAAMEHAREKIRGHYSAAKAFVRQADALAKDRPANDPEVEKLDQQASDEFRAALTLAEQYKVESTAVEKVQSELATLESGSRFKERAALKKLRQEMVTLAGQLKDDPQNAAVLLRLAEFEQKLGLEAEARKHAGLGYGLMAIQAARAEQWKDVQAALDEAHSRAPDSLHTLAAQGLLALRNNPKQALTSFTAALALTTKDSPDRWWLLRDRAMTRAQLARSGASAADLNELRRASEDIASAIKEFPQHPAPPEADEKPSSRHKELAAMYGTKATLAEEIDENQPSDALLQEAVDAFELAARLDRQTLLYPLGVARVTLHRVQRSSASAQAEKSLVKIEQALAAAFALDADWPEAHDIQGELHLLRGDLSAARAAFDRAVAGNDSNRERRQRYLCNLSQAYLRTPADGQKALDAADQALALGGSLVAGRFCRGMALRNLKRPLEAIQEFDQVLSVQPKHVGALLARSQLVVETSGIAAGKVEQAYKDIATALELASTEALQGEAYYVHSLAWLKYHLNNRTQSALAEDSLMKCQTSILEAVKLAPRNTVYQKAADQLFSYAAEFTWQDAELQQKSARLRQQYQTLRPAGNSPEKK